MSFGIELYFYAAVATWACWVASLGAWLYRPWRISSLDFIMICSLALLGLTAFFGDAIL